MALRLNDGAAWVGPIADGKVRVDINGQWITAGYVRVKDAGVWKDTGYRGMPNPPSAPTIAEWNFSTVRAVWSPAAAGGAAIAHYEVQLLAQGGGLLQSENSTDTSSPYWAVNQDTKYQIRVRSVATNGLTSAWMGPVKPQIGHAETYNYGYVERTRPWSSPHLSGGRNRDDPFWVTVWNRVWLTGMHWRDLYTPQSGAVSGTATRTVNLIHGGVDAGVIGPGEVINHNNADRSYAVWGNNTAWGVVARGSGWSTLSNPYYMLHVVDFWCDGTEYYDNYEVVSTNPAVPNSYW